MIEPSQQPNAPNESNHYMKLKRLWTYNECPSTYQPKNISNVQAYPKTFTQIQPSKLKKKSHFVSALITKIRNVERSADSSPIQNKWEAQAKREQKILKAMEKNNSHANQSKLIKKTITKYEPQLNISNDIGFSKISQLSELREENLILKVKMSELIVENEKLKNRFNKFTEGLQERCKEIQRRECELIKQEQSVNQKIRLAEQHVCLQQIPKNLNIVHSFAEHVLPVESGELAKAYQEIKQLKLDKIDLEKKHQVSLNQFRKVKQKDFEKLKKGFANNLKYYKDLLLKVSLKSIPEPKRYQEDTFQTAILQISSADES